ncbi:hypothetical protein ACFVHQ_11610 [Actinomycetes bacterium NPDC127524]
MDQEILYSRMHSMIMSSAKNPKYMSISSAKLAQLWDMRMEDIEEGLKELLEEGRLIKKTLAEPPNYEYYLLPQ